MLRFGFDFNLVVQTFFLNAEFESNKLCKAEYQDECYSNEDIQNRT